MDRCNLTILTTGPGEDLPRFLAEHQVEVVCSLPHYRELNTDRQRGEGVDPYFDGAGPKRHGCQH